MEEVKDIEEKYGHAQYMQIALDIAARIASGELPEGSRIYGRSIMASQYSVSPETIRRALKRLEGMKVVAVKPQSGVVVLSADSAKRYIESFAQEITPHALQFKMKKLLERSEAINKKLIETSEALIKSQETFFAAANTPLPNYEVRIPENSFIIGKSIGELRFWQSTEATVVAIRRGQHVILSPGPFAKLYSGDILVLVGTLNSIERAKSFVEKK